jgi:D-lactate dehydrogenase
VPEESKGNCCGMPFSSKGYMQAFKETAHRTITDFWDWSQGGELPVVIDSSSCAYTLLMSGPKMEPEDWALMRQMTLLDPVDFAFRHLLPKLPINKLERAVVLHPNCSAVKLGLGSKMEAVARACAASVTVPVNLKCCGYAGDRGLLFPELTESAAAPEAEEVNQRNYDGYYSSNLTCEMGMSQATGKPYQSILYLLEAASR